MMARTCLLLVLPIFISTFSLVASPTYLSYLKEGDRYFNEYKNAMALVNYEEAYKMAPHRFDPLFKLIRAINDVAEDRRDANGDKSQIEALFRRSLKLAKTLYEKYPNRTESAFVLAVAHGNLALFIDVKERVLLASKAEALLKKSIELDPSYPYHYLGLGIFYKEVAGISWIERFFGEMLYGEIPEASYADAEKYIKMTLERDPGFIFAHFHLAQVYEEWSKYEKAYFQFQKVIELPQKDHSDPVLKSLAIKQIDYLTKKYPSKFKHFDRPEIHATPHKKPVSGLWSSAQKKTLD